MTPRKIADVEIDLHKALKTEAKLLRGRGVQLLKIGALLIEAKGKVAHGEWLPWLEKNFGRSESTAQSYMNAARWAATKSPTVGDLNLTAGAIYWLSTTVKGPYDQGTYERVRDKVEAEVFQLAKTKLVSASECVHIFKRVEDARAAEARRAQQKHYRQQMKPGATYKPSPGDLERSAAAKADSERRRMEPPPPKPPPPEPAPPPPPTPEEIAAKAARAKRIADTARSLILSRQGRLHSAVRVIRELIPHRADLEGADIEPESLIEAAEFLTSLAVAK